MSHQQNKYWHWTQDYRHWWSINHPASPQMYKQWESRRKRMDAANGWYLDIDIRAANTVKERMWTWKDQPLIIICNKLKIFALLRSWSWLQRIIYQLKFITPALRKTDKARPCEDIQAPPEKLQGVPVENNNNHISYRSPDNPLSETCMTKRE